ncbi:glycosyl hydrolase family 15 protein [Rutstroemia sp. NJR-2017a WRK4]|nr:glycosyl hydrolase family 15 protein [Rutstroemia sp. NJR-2017a WRK4]
MIFGSAAAVLGLLCSPGLAASTKNWPTGNGNASLNAFIAAEKKIALQGVLNNIGPDGSKVAGAGNYVVASPSKVDPDYFYTWTRDSALTLKMIIDEFIFGNSALQPQIEKYVKAQAILQTVSNPSGTFLPNGLGLGEPKYQVDGTRFNGAWGRPQRDGPALRAIALMSYSKWLISHGQSKKAKTVIWPIISNDLSYVGQYWNQTGYDLWEEVLGSSFFTIQNQHRSLVEGAALARQLGVKCTGCDQAPELLCFLQSFWNGQFIDSNINVNEGRTGLDGNSILGSIAVFDVDASCDSPNLQPCSSKALANFRALMNSFRSTYAINAGIANNSGVAVGRYLITTGAAEFLYDAVAQWKSQRSINVDSTSLTFFRDLYPSVKAQRYNSNSQEFTRITNAVTAYADSFVSIAEKYTPADGSLAEQFDRNTGAPLSAVDLTWSYAAFVTMSQRRAGQYPYSWISNSANTPPATCAASSTPGVYSPATAAGAPNVTSSCQIAVQFNVNASTYFGENIYVIGSTDDLGAWNIDNALPMNAGKYTAEQPLWYVDAMLTAGETVSYKFVREENCGQAPIYESGNRTVTVPACGYSGTVVVEDAWVGATGSSGSC